MKRLILRFVCRVIAVGGLPYFYRQRILQNVFESNIQILADGYKHLKLNPPIPLFDVTEVFWCAADLFCKHLLSHSYAFSTSPYIKTNAFIVYRHAVLQRSVMIQSISNFIVLILETNLNDISDYINMGDNI